MSAAFGAAVMPTGPPGTFDAADFIRATIAGGVGSVLGGGKFANGASTRAFTQMFIKGIHHARAWHFAQNAENDAFLQEQGLYGRNDLTVDEIKAGGGYGMKQASSTETAYHRYGEGNENNLKFTSRVAENESWYQRNWSNRYGRYEIIVRPNGDGTYTHVTAHINMGTLNRGNNPITHWYRDVVPYQFWGNVPD